MLGISENSKIKNAKKGTILLHQGEKCLHSFKVKSGCLKSYVIDKTGKEHILQFAPENWLISDINSFINDLPSTIFIEAIEDSELILIKKNILTNFENQPKESLIQLVKTLTNNVINANKRLALLLSSTSEERYLEFIQTYPTLLQRLPLKLIASYLGMTPEYLSDVRRKLANK